MRHVSLVRSAAGAAVFTLLLGAGLGHAAPEGAGAPAEAGKADAKVIGPPEVAWKDMTGEQRGRFMKMVITPKMKAMFQEFDSKTFAKVTCATCHGKDAKEQKFKMPNPHADIKPLPPTPEAFMAAMKTNKDWSSKWVPFMKDKVMPQMASLLGLPAFDPKKPDPTAFGCKNCHTLAK